MADGQVKIQIIADGKDAEKVLKQIQVNANDIGPSAEKGSVGIKGIATALGLVKIASSALGLIKNGISEMIGDLSESSAAWKTFDGNMKNLGKSSGEIGKVKNELKKFAQETIYSSSDMATTYSQLAAVGIKDTTKLVKGFGGLAAAAANPQQAMTTLSQQATQMASKPKVAWEDFKLMLEQTPAGVAAVAKTMGMSTADMVKSVQDGSIKTQDFFNAVAKTGTNANFSKMATQYKTVGQAMDGLKETVTNKLQPSFDKASQKIINLVSKITDFIGEVNFEPVINGFKNVINFIKPIAPILGILTAGFATFLGVAGAMSGTVKTIQGVSSAFKALKVVMMANPFALVIAGIVMFGLAMAQLYKKSETFRNIVDGITSKIKTLVTSLAPLGIPFEKLGATIGLVSKLIVGYLTDFNGAFQKTREQLVKLLGPELANKITINLVKILGPISDFRIGIKALAGVANGSIKDINQLYGALGGSFGEKGTQVILKIGTAIRNFVDSLKEFKFPSDLLDFKLLIPIFGALFSPLGAIIGVFKVLSLVLGNSTVQKGLSTMVEGFASFGKEIKKVGPTAGKGVGDMMSGILGAIASALPKIIAGGIKVVGGLISGIAQGLPSLTFAIIQLIGSLTGTILALIPTVAAAGLSILAALTGALVAGIGTITVCAAQLIVAFTGALLVLMPTIIASGASLLVSFISGLTIQIPKIMISVGQMITTFLLALTTQLPRIVSAGMTLLITFLSGIISKLPELMNTVSTLITTFLDTLTANLPSIIESGVNTILAFLKGIADHLPDLMTVAVDVIVAFLTGISDNLERIISAGVGIVVSILNGIANNISRIVDAGMNIVDSIVSGIVQTSDRLFNAVTNLLNGLAESVRNNAPQMRAAAGNLMTAIIEAFPGGKLVTTGMNLISGLAKGIGQAASRVVSAAVDVAGDVVNSVKKTLGIHSPSRVMAELGRYTGQGLANGIANMAGEVQKASDKLADAALIDKNKLDFSGTNLPQLEAFENGTITAETLLNGKIGQGKSIPANVSNITNNYENQKNSEIVSLLRQIRDTDFSTYLNGDKVSNLLGKSNDRTQGKRTELSEWGLELG